jgi:hypothetical protein
LTHDQVVIEPTGLPRLIDFDRACLDRPAYDLGSWAAQSLLDAVDTTGIATDPMVVLDPLLEGYRTIRPSPDTGEILVSTACAIFRRAVDPFRQHSPGWARQVQRRLALAVDVLPT